MPLDALAKRYFPAIVLALIALSAYLQAAGIMQLVTSALLGDGAPPRDGPAATAVAVSVASRPPRTADPILSRNPFDSAAGPLSRTPPAPEQTETAPTGAPDLSSPLTAPDCGGVTARVITESTDPTWSIAALQGPGDSTPRLRRVGDAVGDKQVAYIGFNPSRATPAVWLVGGGALCQVALFSLAPAAAPQAAAPAAAPAPAAEPKKGGAAGAVPPEIANRIKKVSDTEFQVDRAVVDNILENQAQLMRTARIVPEQKDGKIVGIRLFGIRPDTLLGKLGLQNGDRLETINGFEMASPEKALEAYARLRTADSLNVKVTRRGQPVSIDFKIQ